MSDSKTILTDVDTEQEALAVRDFINRTFTMFGNHPSEISEVEDKLYLKPYKIVFDSKLSQYTTTLSTIRQSVSDYRSGFKDGLKVGNGNNSKGQ